MRKVAVYDVDFQDSIFKRIAKGWMLVTAGTKESLNTMTASWGGVGVLWHMNMATIYIRPERYTDDYIQREDYFSVAFFSEQYRKELTLCGKKSGREVDKVETCGFTVREGEAGGIFFEEAEIVLVCRKRYSDMLKLENMIDLDPNAFYGGAHGGVHRMYMGEIVEAYVK